MDTRHDEIHGEASLPFMDDKTHHHPGAIHIIETALKELTAGEFEQFCDHSPVGKALWEAYQRFAHRHPNRCSILDYAQHVLAQCST